jgi:pseudaminic acid cytidylyltransferase
MKKVVNGNSDVKQNTVAIIPARGGSKRIPNKNIKKFCGRHMLSYPIQAAKTSGLFDRIIVSTDSKEISKVARECGAEVPFMRPLDLADDYTGTNAVVRHCLQWLTEQGVMPIYACCIYATTPFLQPEFLQKGFRLLKESKGSFAFAVTSFPSPILRAVKIREDGMLDAFFPEFVPKNSQDLEKAYHDAGQFYWGTAKSFLSKIPLFSPSSIPVVLPRYFVQDIDEPDDWRRAELMYMAWVNEKAENIINE